jgi:hypothetical protein
VIAVCQHRNFDVYDFIDEQYNTAHLLNTWSGQFHCYGDKQVWPPYLGETIIPDKELIKIGRRAKVRRRMVMDEMEGRIRGQGRTRNIQSSEGGSLPMDTLQSGRHRSRPSSPTTNRRTQTSRNILQSSRHSTSYDPRDNNKITQTSRDVLQSAKHSTSYDLRDNNRITQTYRDALQSTRFSIDMRVRQHNQLIPHVLHTDV